MSGGSGTVGGAAVTSVTVNCATDQFTLCGTINGLAGGGLTLSLNSGAVILPVGNNGTFSFPTTLPSGTPYAVTVASQPSGPTQTCTVANGAGTVVAANVGDVEVDCTTNSYAIGGTVSGLAGMGLTLQNNGGDDLSVDGRRHLRVPDQRAQRAGLRRDGVGAADHPLADLHGLGGSGGVAGADVTNVAITCTTNTYKVGGRSADWLVGRPDERQLTRSSSAPTVRSCSRPRVPAAARTPSP